jgi:RNA polymerase sigma-70 factor (ECF subfamily)
MWDRHQGVFVAHGITVLTLRGDRILEITAFLTPEAFAHFGMPDEMEA